VRNAWLCFGCFFVFLLRVFTKIINHLKQRKMEKLNLKNALKGLSRNEMRAISGGSGGTCCASPVGYETVCGLRKADALAYLGGGRGRWCCASC
jgi:hypothetical protein